MVPAIKVYKMDYSFIIKNYLNPALWKRVWTLFEYGDFVITIRIASIDTINNKITFTQQLKDNSGNCTYSTDENSIVYSLNGSKIEFLIKNINGTILRSIQYHEKHHVFETLDIYKSALEQGEREREKLNQIASDFLDNEGVKNEEIRECYIDSYVSNNTTNGMYISNLMTAFQYHLLTDLYLVFLDSIGDENNYKLVLDSLGDDEIEAVTQKINEFKDYIETKDYEEEMHNLLEEI